MIQHGIQRFHRNLIRFNKNQRILTQGQLTKFLYVLVQGIAAIRSEGQVVHQYTPGNIINKVQALKQCGMLKTVFAVQKCKISIISTNIKTNLAQQQIKQPFKQFISNYCNKQQIVCEIMEKCIVKLFQTPESIAVSNSTLYLISSGKVQIKRNQNLMKKIETQNTYPIHFENQQNIHIRILQNANICVLNTKVLQYFMSFQQYKKLINFANFCSQAPISDNKDKSIKCHSSYENYKNQQPLKQTLKHKNTGFKNRKRKILSQTCSSVSKFNFSLNFRKDFRKIARTRSGIQMIKKAHDDKPFQKIFRSIKGQLCCIHKKSCNQQVKRKESMVRFLKNHTECIKF